MDHAWARETRPRSTLRLEDPVVRIIVAVTALITVAMWVLYVMSGERAFLVHAATSAFASTLGALQIVLRRENTYVLVMTSAIAISLNVTYAGSPATRFSSLAGLMVIGIGATLFSSHPKLHIAIYGLFLATSTWSWSESEPPTGLFEGLTIGFVFAFGAGVIDWVRAQADTTAARHENLFRTAPVSLWREDFSAVVAWLTSLRASGVDDLATYLDSRPHLIDRATSLIEVTEVNQAAVDLLELDDVTQLLGTLDPAGATESSRLSVRDQLLAVWEGETHVVTEIRDGRTARGNRLEGLLSFAVPEVDGRPDYSQVTVAIVDVTEGRMARAQLEALVESKDQLVAAVSHELRTPLTAVVGLAQELSEHFEDFTDDEVAEFIRMIAAQSEDVSLIVEDLLVAAQAESGEIHIAPEPTNVADQVDIVVEGLRPEPVIDVQLLAPVGPAHADPGRLRQIIRNLVTNATRYGSAPVRIVIADREENVTIEVRDQGLPLPEQQRVDIFNRYHRAKERPGVAASVGVGLTVSRELARAMGGELTYDHDGETVFTLTLPKWADEAERLAG
jgi:signal transduction histidine kinase